MADQVGGWPARVRELEERLKVAEAEVERLRGLAYDLERLVFHGGRNYGPDESFRIVQAMLKEGEWRFVTDGVTNSV